MPIYEYRCLKCGHEFEVLQKISDAPISKCKKCGKKVEKKVSLSGFQLKGSGWYADGYTKNKPSPAKPETKKESEPSKKSETPAKPAKDKAA